MKVFIISPVRNASENLKKRIARDVRELEVNGFEVYNPRVDNQYQLSDDTGYEICWRNMEVMEVVHLILVYYDSTSQGVHFDLGMAFAMKKPIVVINMEYGGDINKKQKSFPRMLYAWRRKCNIDRNPAQVMFLDQWESTVNGIIRKIQ